MTATFATIGMGALVHEAGYRSAGQWDYMARIMAWAADYLRRAHVVVSDVPAQNVIVTQVGQTGTDHSYWGRPEQQVGIRPTLTSKDTKASDIMAGAASVFAATSMILNKSGAYKASHALHFTPNSVNDAALLIATSWLGNAMASAKLHVGVMISIMT
jgi:endoglucanase